MAHPRFLLVVIVFAAVALPLAPALLSQMSAPATTRRVLPTTDFPPDNRPRGMVTTEELLVERLRTYGIENPDPAPTGPKSRTDSLAWARHRENAALLKGPKVIISIFERRLWLVDAQGDTIIEAAAGVGMGLARLGDRSYDFSTPRGLRRVLAKEENPLWTPPDWHYYGLFPDVRAFPSTGVPLSSGGRLVQRGTRLGILRGDSFETLPRDHQLVFDGVLYIPPVGTLNRQLPEVLGKHKIDTGEGILIHGTNDPAAIGFAATHGCIRIADEPLARLYRAVRIGTPVYIY